MTGATGGLGLTLVPVLLAHGYRVRAAGRRARPLARLAAAGCECVAAELTEPGAPDRLAAGMDVVFHAAARSSPWGPEESFRADNLDSTVRLLHAAAAAGATGFVYVSTPSIYAEARDRLALTEASPPAPRPVNAYTATKAEAERRVLAADRLGFATMVLRPRALVGPNDRVLLPRLLRIARRGWFPLFRGGRALLDLTDVRDAAEALLAADRRLGSAHGRVFNVSGGRPLAARELLATAFDALGFRPRLVELPHAPVARLVAGLEAACRVLPGQPEPPITSYTLSALAFSQTFDLRGAREALGWAPRHDPCEALRWAARGIGL